MKIQTLLLSAGLLCMLPTHAADNKGMLVELSAEASRSSSNDLFRATVFAEASDNNPAVLARQVNQSISQGLALAKTYSDVKVKTGASYTLPLYGKTQRTIESWRMRSELQLESKNAAAFNELLGKLQASLAVSHLSALPAPETANKAEADAMVAAIGQFKERAALIASTLGKKYKIVEMHVGNNSRTPQYSMTRNKALMSASAEAPMPIEAGESLVSVNITGKIELND